MGPIEMWKLMMAWRKAQAITKETVTMKAKWTQYVTLFVSVAATLGVPELAARWVQGHAEVYAVLVAAAIVLHAIFPSIFAAPGDAEQKATGFKTSVVLLMIGLGAWMVAPARAQVQTAAIISAPTATMPATTTAAPAPAAQTGFSAASDAVAIHYGGEWSAGTLVTESYDFFDFGQVKGSHLYLEGHELLAPTPGFNAYLGGIQVEPDLSAIFKKTNLAPGDFSGFFTASIGNGIPSSGGSHISYLLGGGVKYRLTTALTWTSLQAQYGRFGTQPFEVLSTGLLFAFGK